MAKPTVKATSAPNLTPAYIPGENSYNRQSSPMATKKATPKEEVATEDVAEEEVVKPTKRGAKK